MTMWFESTVRASFIFLKMMRLVYFCTDALCNVQHIQPKPLISIQFSWDVICFYALITSSRPRHMMQWKLSLIRLFSQNRITNPFICKDMFINTHTRWQIDMPHAIHVIYINLLMGLRCSNWFSELIDK